MDPRFWESKQPAKAVQTANANANTKVGLPMTELDTEAARSTIAPMRS